MARSGARGKEASRGGEEWGGKGMRRECKKEAGGRRISVLLLNILYMCMCLSTEQLAELSGEKEDSLDSMHQAMDGSKHREGRQRREQKRGGGVDREEFSRRTH